MLELPHISVHLEAPTALVPDRGLETVRLASPFPFRSVDPGPPKAERP